MTACFQGGGARTGEPGEQGHGVHTGARARPHLGAEPTVRRGDGRAHRRVCRQGQHKDSL
jgi:hypothetical protein